MQHAGENLERYLTISFRPKFLLPFDHHFPGKAGEENKPVVTVVLYGDFGSQNEFKPFHSKLSSLALNGKIDYVLRHNSKVSYSMRVAHCSVDDTTILF